MQAIIPIPGPVATTQLLTRAVVIRPPTKRLMHPLHPSFKPSLPALPLPRQLPHHSAQSKQPPRTPLQRHRQQLPPSLPPRPPRIRNPTQATNLKTTLNSRPAQRPALASAQRLPLSSYAQSRLGLSCVAEVVDAALCHKDRNWTTAAEAAAVIA